MNFKEDLKGKQRDNLKEIKLDLIIKVEIKMIQITMIGIVLILVRIP